MTAMDIRSTLANVCRRVLHDTSVDSETLLKRFLSPFATFNLFMIQLFIFVEIEPKPSKF